jgi:hypothetical protein
MTVLDTDHLSVLERRDQPGSGALRSSRTLAAVRRGHHDHQF